MSNKQTFQDTLTRHYRELFATPAFAYAASKTTPEALAVKMTEGLADGTALHTTGEGVWRTCKELGLRQSVKEISNFLAV